MSDRGNGAAGHPGGRTVSVDEALDFAARQVRHLVDRAPGQTPTYTENGRWVFGADPWAPTWSGGFLAGLLWIVAERSGDSWWRQQAERYCGIVEPYRDRRDTHDLGFVLEPSWGRWAACGGGSHAVEVLADGGRTMAQRFQRTGGYLCSWVDPGNTFVDIMMNVGIVFRAAEETGDAALAEIARRHCRTTRRFLLRGDGSTVHEGWFDTATGEFLHAGTHQGWRPDSTWARGQAWAIYGFAEAYRHSDDVDLLDAARRAADFYMARTPRNGVPPNDWEEPAPILPVESSAAAIAAAGMLRLAAQLDRVARRPEADAAARYRHYALGILQTLRSTDYLAIEQPGWEGILRHATYHQRKGLGIDESMMFGDYYFVEALDLASHLPGSAVLRGAAEATGTWTDGGATR